MGNHDACDLRSKKVAPTDFFSSLQMCFSCWSSNEGTDYSFHRSTSESSSSTSRIKSSQRARYDFRIAVTGSRGTGKTTLLWKLIRDTLPDPKREKNIGDDYQWILGPGDGCSKTLIGHAIDLSGFDDFPAMRRLSMSRADIYLVLVNPLHSESINYAKQRLQEIADSVLGKSALVVLVTTKSDDLAPDDISVVTMREQLMRHVETAHPHLVLACRFVAVSSLAATGLKDLTGVIVQYLYRIKNLGGKPPCGAVFNSAVAQGSSVVTNAGPSTKLSRMLGVCL